MSDFYPISFSRLLLISLYLSISIIVIILKMIASSRQFPYRLYFPDIPRSVRLLLDFNQSPEKGTAQYCDSNVASVIAVMTGAVRWNLGPAGEKKALPDPQTSVGGIRAIW